MRGAAFGELPCAVGVLRGGKGWGCWGCFTWVLGFGWGWVFAWCVYVIVDAVLGADRADWSYNRSEAVVTSGGIVGGTVGGGGGSGRCRGEIGVEVVEVGSVDFLLLFLYFVTCNGSSLV